MRIGMSVVLLTVGIFGGGMAWAQPGDLPAQLHAIAQKAADAGVFSGVVRVTRGDEAVYEEAFGLADRERKIPLTPQTRFVLASVTKQFTAALVLRQVERGALNLEDPVTGLLPGLPAAWKSIRLRHLLGHTSGLYDYLNGPDLDQFRHIKHTPEQLVARFRGHALNFSPGTRYSYSNSGYVLLGMVLERTVGLPLREQLARAVFGPAPMLASGVQIAPNGPAPFAVGYEKASAASPWKLAQTIEPTVMFALGDIYATAADLGEWNRLLTRGPLLADASRARMFQPGLGNYGLGVRVAQVSGHREIWHTGHVAGYSNYIGHYVDDDVCVVVLSNLINAPAADIGRALARAVFGDKTPAPEFELAPAVEMQE
jgi:CubicO group peptidase (beta-lactamase class C family)